MKNILNIFKEANWDRNNIKCVCGGESKCVKLFNAIEVNLFSA